jgi:cystathionine gamma-synthase
MQPLQHFPLGAGFSSSPHAVVRSLPKMADVRGYEEKTERVMQAMESGYPRFVVHKYIRLLTDSYLQEAGLVGCRAVLVAGRRAAVRLLSFCGEGLAMREMDVGVFLVYTADLAGALVERMGKYVQHTGCGISSRQAEDLLVEHGHLPAAFEETACLGNAESKAEQRLAAWMGCGTRDVLLCASGMSAFYAGFESVREYQRGQGRRVWLQLGWLYLDSGLILEGFLGDGETLECMYHVSDTEVILKRIRALGSSLAAVVVECPSNPLLQVCDLERVSGAVRDAGGVMMVDPSMASVVNSDVLPQADLLVTSLTKYTAFEGDVMAGALALNPDSPHYGGLVARVSAFHVPPYARDLARLVHEMGEAVAVVAQMNANAARLVQYLTGHPAVKRVFYAGAESGYEAIRSKDGGGGAVLSIELAGSMEAFYDAVRVMKGPSFGTYRTLLSPFMYLAHYDLVTSESGRALLAEAGIEPELIRISVGIEPYKEIEAVFAESLAASLQ